MKQFMKYFHYLSYVQYLFLAWAIFYWLMFFIGEENEKFSNLNNSLILFGISISFTSFYDLNKKNNITDKLFLKPTLFKVYLAYVLLLSISLIFTGIYLYFISEEKNGSDISVGLIVLGVGVLNLLKMSIERAKILSIQEL